MSKRHCDWCGKPAPIGPALLSIWWADYECCRFGYVDPYHDCAPFGPPPCHSFWHGTRGHICVPTEVTA